MGTSTTRCDGEAQLVEEVRIVDFEGVATDAALTIELLTLCPPYHLPRSRLIGNDADLTQFGRSAESCPSKEPGASGDSDASSRSHPGWAWFGTT